MPVTDRPIAYAGEPGAFAEDAVLAAFGDVRADGARQLPGGLRGGRPAATPAAGVVPIENVINGTVRENYDLLVEFDLAIHGEVMVPVRLCLAALPGQRLEDIERVYSHIQALGQAEAFLRSRPWQLLSTYNTAGAGKAIADAGERGAGRGPVAARGRLVRAGAARGRHRRPARQPDALPRPRPARRPRRRAASIRRAHRRTTLVVAVRNEPGTLLAVLRVIAAHGLNMRKLESRPSRERAWEYVFWIDLDGDRGRSGDGRRPRRGPWRHHDDARAGELPEPGRLTPQISLVQALHFVASSAFGSLQYGQVFTSSAGASLMKVRLICQTTKAMITNAITALTNAP